MTTWRIILVMFFLCLSSVCSGFLLKPFCFALFDLIADSLYGNSSSARLTQFAYPPLDTAGKLVRGAGNPMTPFPEREKRLRRATNSISTTFLVFALYERWPHLVRGTGRWRLRSESPVAPPASSWVVPLAYELREGESERATYVTATAAELRLHGGSSPPNRLCVIHEGNNLHDHYHYYRHHQNDHHHQQRQNRTTRELTDNAKRRAGVVTNVARDQTGNEMWRNSPWDILSIKWDDDESTSAMCPWEPRQVMMMHF